MLLFIYLLYIHLHWYIILLYICPPKNALQNITVLQKAPYKNNVLQKAPYKYNHPSKSALQNKIIVQKAPYKIKPSTFHFTNLNIVGSFGTNYTPYITTMSTLGLYKHHIYMFRVLWVAVTSSKLFNMSCTFTYIRTIA